jgi:L-rhamnose-H+ transport protein
MNDLVQPTTNPALGIIIFVLGGLAGAVFYLPLKKVKSWAWESYWLFWALFALLIVPIALALITSPNTFSVLKAAPGREVLYCYLCGAAWGFGGLTWGLMIRYLGVGLGLAMGCGLCSAAGTIVPKILKGEFGELFQSNAGICSFVGVLVSIFGIVLVGLAGMSKEKELPEEEKKKSVAEYNFKKGMLVALFSGLMSAALGFGLVGGPSIEKLALTTQPVTPLAWAGMPVLVIALLGGFTVNFLWCLFLNAKNKTFGDYTKKGAPIVPNVIFGAIAGAIWVCQFVAFKTADGQPKLRRLGRADGQLHHVQRRARPDSRRMEGHQQPHPRPARTRPRRAAWLRRSLRLQRQAGPGRRQTTGPDHSPNPDQITRLGKTSGRPLTGTAF